MSTPVTRPDLESAESKLMALKHRYLEEHGWKYTCKTPGATWLWRKIHLDEVYMMNMNMALVIEEALSPQ